MNTNKAIAVTIAWAVVLGYLLLFGRAIVECWLHGPATLSLSDNYVYVATALSGLVGGVMAMRFNEKLPVVPLGETGGEVISASGTAPVAIAIRKSVASVDSGLETASSLYAWAYVIGGVASIVTWVNFGQDTPELITNSAMIALGLLLAIARSAVTVTQSA